MVFLLHGADSFRRRQKLNELKERFMATVDILGQSLIVLDGQQVGAQELQEKISSGSLFTKKRMIVLENIFANKNEAVFTLLLKLTIKNAGAEDNALVFSEDELSPTKLKAEAKKLHAWLLKQPFVQEFKPLNNTQVFDFASKEIKARGSQISPSALSLLIARVGNDLWRLDNEISKLCAASENKLINDLLVQDLVKAEIEDNIFALTDALGAKNGRLVLRLLEEQFAAGLSAEYLLAMFQRQFKIMLQIKAMQAESHLSETQLASKLKLHPFVVKKGLNQSSKFTLIELQRQLDNLFAIDYKNKQGRADIKGELYALAAALA